MRYRRPLKITSRTSSVTNSFVQAIIPDHLPDAEEHAIVLALLGQDRFDLRCVYCGDKAQHWDHLNPFVRGKKPTGFLNEAGNLVPACGPCNTSKSGHDWLSWMYSAAVNSPKSRAVKDIDQRAAQIHEMVQKVGLQGLDFASMVEPEVWSNYWSRLAQIEQLLFDAQAEADVIRQKIANKLKRQNPT